MSETVEANIDTSSMNLQTIIWMFVTFSMDDHALFLSGDVGKKRSLTILHNKANFSLN